MAYKTRNCNSLQGGGSRALDSYGVAGITNGGRAICAHSDEFLYFKYNATGTAAEQVTTHPYIIRPDDYSTGGNWEEQVVDKAAKGANSDITSMTGLTTPLDETYGGTGMAAQVAGDILYASGANTLARLAKGSAGQALVMNSGATAPEWGSVVTDYVKVSDVKAYNLAGGTFTAGAWQTRVINTEDSDDSGICSISSNLITLAAGTYTCQIQCPFYATGRSISRLLNHSDTTEILLGGVLCVGSSDVVVMSNVIVGKFVLAAQKMLAVQHYCQATKADDGFGLETGISGINSIYTVAEFWRV